MRIELEKLKERGGEFAHTYQAGELLPDDGEARLVAPAEVKGIISRRGSEVEVRGDLTARVEVGCGRCLKPVTISVDAAFDERFTPTVAWRSESQHELAEEDLNLSIFDGETIDLDDLVREEILLAIPGHVLCREDCRGLCLTCGADRNVTDCDCESKNVDSRWHGLKDIQL